VALGVAGTTLLDELNRLANGGTYRAPGEMVGEALAARQWAVQRSVSNKLNRHGRSIKCDCGYV
jgi:hypothetical protein